MLHIKYIAHSIGRVCQVSAFVFRLDKMNITKIKSISIKDPYKNCVFRNHNNCGKGKYGEINMVNVSQLDSDTEIHFKI